MILPSVGGKDTDPNLTYETLQYGQNLFLQRQNISERIFVGGDQKAMSITLRLRKQYTNSLKFTLQYLTYISETL